ncbi:hypothetical protein PC116_g33039, partial [Phytophthora cactorum]
MAPLTIASRALARGVARSCSRVNAARALSSTTQLNDAAGSYSSPFKGEPKSTKIPDFSHYMAK